MGNKKKQTILIAALIAGLAVIAFFVIYSGYQDGKSDKQLEQSIQKSEAAK
jgi:hypothetical protein